MAETLNTRFAVLLTFLLTTALLQGQNWPNWRGPNSNGIAETGNYPKSFNAEDVAWKAPLPGIGGSTPIVWEDRIILTSGIGEGDDGEDGVLCFDLEGTRLWEVKLGKQIPGKHPRGSGSSPSAVTDGKHIFVLFKTTTLAALDFQGKVLWKSNLQDRFGEVTFWWDFGSSPVLAGDQLVVAMMHEGHSYLLSLEKTTGNVIWKTDRNYDCKPESAQSYTTPLVINEGNESTIVVWGADHLTGHDAATGKLKWTYSGFNPNQQQYWRTIASPLVYEDVAVVPYGRGRFLAAMKVNVTGNMTENEWLWSKTGIGTDVATPVAINQKIYVLGFNGKLWCIDIQTGNELWETKLPDSKGLFYSSPTLAGNHLYMCSDEGSFYVCEIKDDGIKIITQTQFDDHFVATPVLVQDKLLIRGTKWLYCITNQ